MIQSQMEKGANMNPSAVRTWSILLAIAACSVVRSDDSQPPSASGMASLLSSLQGKTWATVSGDQGGYELRLLTDEEKTGVEETIDRYREVRGRDDATDDETERVTTAYRSMPSDVRSARFYKIRRLGPDAVELKGDDLHAIMPMTSIRIALLGPTGSLSTSDRSSRSSAAAGRGPSPEEFLRALRGSRGGFAGSSSRSSGSVARGFPGSPIRANEQSGENNEPKTKLTLFYLKYAAATSVARLIPIDSARGSSSVPTVAPGSTISGRNR